MPEFQRYPLALYRQGWADLGDTVTVESEAEEAHARKSGFRMLAEAGQADAAQEPAAEPAKPRRGRKPKAAE